MMVYIIAFTAACTFALIVSGLVLMGIGLALMTSERFVDWYLDKTMKISKKMINRMTEEDL